MILTEIAKYLHNHGVCRFDETGDTGNTFIEKQPPSPDICVTLYTSPGTPGDSKNGYDTPGVQVLVRGTHDPRIAYDLAYDVYNRLHGFTSGVLTAQYVTVDIFGRAEMSQTTDADGTWVVSCLATQTPVHIGRDKKGRHEYSINFMLDIRNNSAHRE